VIQQLLAAAAPAVKASAAAAGAAAKAALPAGPPIKGAVSATAPPLQVPIAPAIAPHQTWLAQHAGWLTHTLAAFSILFSLLLILLLALQTTKQEGLSGTIGGRVESAYGRPGGEELLKRWTGIVAVGFVITFVILSLTGI
jgi:preprotein translocase subunit SecG